MPFDLLTVEQLEIGDEPSFRHVALYAELKESMRADGVRFAVPRCDDLTSSDAASLLNLAFWKPGKISEILPDASVYADQLTHNAWHHLAHKHLGEMAQSASGLLFAEAIASAFDVYLIGRLLGHSPDSAFLSTQVPAMSEAASTAGADEEQLAKLFETFSSDPEKSFESLRQLLFDTTRKLVACRDAEAAATVLAEAAEHPFGVILHHYELSTWTLYTKAYANDGAPAEELMEFDQALRDASDSLALLQQRWLA